MVHSIFYFQGLVLDKIISGIFSSYFSVPCHVVYISPANIACWATNYIFLTFFRRWTVPWNKYVLQLKYVFLRNLIEITLRHGCSPANLLHIFRTPFSRNTSEWLLLATVLQVLYTTIWFWIEYFSVLKTHWH